MRISDWSSDVCSSDLDEYQIDCLTAYPGEILELGRSCVDPTYRSGATMQLLWRGIAEYVFYHDISIMFGCASLPGTDPEQLRMPLAYLRHHHLAPRALRARAVPERYVSMDLLPPDEVLVSGARQAQLGRASCRESVWQYG